MPSTLLTIPHHPQRSDGDCLAACAAMVLEHLVYSLIWTYATDHAVVVVGFDKQAVPQIYP